MRLLIGLAVGMIAMFVVAFWRKSKYEISIWKLPIIVIALVISGIAGVKAMYFIENGTWEGLSLYGSIFLIPVVMPLVARILRIPYGRLMDFSAIEILAMLCVMKIMCIINECCGGIPIKINEIGEGLYFPSQLVETFVMLGIIKILWSVEADLRFHNKLYPWLLVLYGGSRFVLNTFRIVKPPFVWVLPAGHFWSVIAVLVGVILLTLLNRRRSQHDIEA